MSIAFPPDNPLGKILGPTTCSETCKLKGKNCPFWYGIGEETCRTEIDKVVNEVRTTMGVDFKKVIYRTVIGESSDVLVAVSLDGDYAEIALRHGERVRI